MPELSEYPENKPQALIDLAQGEYNDRAAAMAQAWRYYRGDMKRPLKVRQNQPDDNVIFKLCGKMIAQAVALLFRKTPAFQLDDNADKSPVETVLDELWTANRKATFLNNLATNGALSGHCYVKLLPTNDMLRPVRFVALKPEQVSVFWAPDDLEKVTAYVVYWKAGETEYREDHINRGASWDILNMTRKGGGEWTVTNEASWPFGWAQIVDWQNLPDPQGYYGTWDLDNPQLNDALNFVASNTQRIIRYHAHPRTIGTGFRSGDVQDTSVDAFFTIANPDAKVQNLEMQSDLTASMGFMQQLQAQFWSEHRGVDLTSIKDRLGQLTNFGLRVLFGDAMDKLGTKRELYGMGLQHINRRALELLGYGADNLTQIVWADVLPSSGLETTQTQQMRLDMGIQSKQTTAMALGLDWEQEQARMDDEKAGDTDIGTMLLGAFERGQTQLQRGQMQEGENGNGRQQPIPNA